MTITSTTERTASLTHGNFQTFKCLHLFFRYFVPIELPCTRGKWQSLNLFGNMVCNVHQCVIDFIYFCFCFFQMALFASQFWKLNKQSKLQTWILIIKSIYHNNLPEGISIIIIMESRESKCEKVICSLGPFLLL